MPKKNATPAVEAKQIELEDAIAAAVGDAVAAQPEQPSAPPVEASSEPPPMIGENDPEGRQPGDPNAPIELPSELLAPPAQASNMIAFDTPEQMEAFLASLPASEPVAREGVAVDIVRQPPELSAKTMAELSAGREAVTHSSAAENQMVEAGEKPAPEKPAKAAPEALAAAFSRPVANQPVAGVPVLHPRTIAEQEAGRAALARKHADISAARAGMAAANAARLKKGAAPDAGDLSYSPRA
jgi:hypothetical protein